VLRDNGQYLVAGENEELLEKFNADPEIYDRVAVMPFSPPDSSNLGEAESVDMVLTFRNVHGWLGRGLAEDNFKEFSRVLKPGEYARARSRAVAVGFVGRTSICPLRPCEWYASASSRRIFFLGTGLPGGFCGGLKSVAMCEAPRDRWSEGFA
jgi:hypothetical protein